MKLVVKEVFSICDRAVETSDRQNEFDPERVRGDCKLWVPEVKADV